MHIETGASPESCPCLFSVRRCRGEAGAASESVQYLQSSLPPSSSPLDSSPKSLSGSSHGRLAVSLLHLAGRGKEIKKKKEERKPNRRIAKKGFLITLNNTPDECAAPSPSKVSIRSAAVFQQSGVQGNTKGISADLAHKGGKEREVWHCGLRGEGREVHTY